MEGRENTDIDLSIFGRSRKAIPDIEGLHIPGFRFLESIKGHRPITHTSISKCFSSIGSLYYAGADTGLDAVMLLGKALITFLVQVRLALDSTSGEVYISHSEVAISLTFQGISLRDSSQRSNWFEHASFVAKAAVTSVSVMGQEKTYNAASNKSARNF